MVPEKKAELRVMAPECVANLEAQKCKLLAELQQIDNRLDREELGLEWDIDTAAVVTSLVPRLVRKGDPFVAERNEIIDKNLNLSDLEICRHLDQEFGWGGRECGEHLPKPWVGSLPKDLSG
jgi:hypothetical protein